MIIGFQAPQTKILTAMTAQIGANKDFVHALHFWCNTGSMLMKDNNQFDIK